MFSIKKFWQILGMFTILFAHASAWASHPEHTDRNRGEVLFSRYCSVCHGDRGQGGVGVPLSLPDFINQIDDNYLHKTIQLGRPGRVMPAFKKLGTQDIKALISYMRSWTGRKGKNFSTARINGNPIQGKKLYGKYCAACHGTRGEGGHGTGVTMSRPRGMPILAPALNNPGFLAAASDGMIKHSLMFGRKGTPMRSFLKQGLSQSNINDIVAYVRSFEKIPKPARKELLVTESPIIMRVSPYSLKETVDALKNAILSANMRLIRVQYLTQGFDKPGKENKKQVIIYSCNFRFLYKAMAVDPRVGMFLPCRITVVEHKGKVLVMSINPLRLSAIYNNTELNELCKEMHGIYKSIIEETVM